MAVNPAFVEDILEHDVTANGFPIAKLDLSCPFEAGDVLIIGKPEDVQNVLMQGTKIGIQSAELRLLTGTAHDKVTPTIMNHLNRVCIVEELYPDELNLEGIGAGTISAMFEEDGAKKVIVERPGTFIMQANQGRDIPNLSYK